MNAATLVPLLALLWLGPQGPGESPRPPSGTGDVEPTPPDVLMIFVDDVNDWVGYIGGHPGARTPNIDRLAERGVGFTNAHCFAPLCQPSRTQLLYGQRVATYELNDPDPSVPVITDLFAERGYRVIGGGKIFHGGNAEHFGEYFELPPAPKPTGRKNKNLLAYEQDIGTFDWASLEVPDEQMPDHQLVTWACERLAEKSNQPLFLAVGLTKPHLPWYVPAEYFERHPLAEIELPLTAEDDLEDLPDQARRASRDQGVDQKLRRRGNRERAVQGYLAALSFADAQVGRLLDALEASPRADRTCVVLLSDHGLHLGEKAHWRKQSLWEDGTRVPLIFAAPGTPPGQRCSRPVDLSSIYPTLLELCGMDVPEKADGHSLVPLLGNPAAEWPHVAVTLQRGNAALRDDRYRYIRYKKGGEELYDHQVDPHEWRNLAGDPERSATLKRLRARLDEELATW